MASSTAASLHAYPAHERNRFLYLMWRDPSNYLEWIEQFTSRTISRLSWGSARSAPLLRKTTMGLLETISPSGSLPNVISCLAHLPESLSPWKQRERRRHALEERLFRSNVDSVRRSMGLQQDSSSRSDDSSFSLPSFTRSFLSRLRGEQHEGGEEAAAVGGKGQCDEQEATYVVGLMAIAGTLTIGSPIQSFILAMCHYPEWQSHLQEEIDVMLGGRCPEWGDRMKLPLLRAVVKEVIRWRPPVPTGMCAPFICVGSCMLTRLVFFHLGIPHTLEKDDVYDGYFIPAGATIHALEWYVLRTETPPHTQQLHMI